MELNATTVDRTCWCGAVTFEVSESDAQRIDAGEAGLRCGQACWAYYLARNPEKRHPKP